MRWAVCVITPLQYPHSAAFAEVAETLHHGLLSLGVDSVLSTRLDNRRRRHLILGSNLLTRYPQPLPDDAVLYNLEQISPESSWFAGGLLDILRSRPLWDYSRSNIAALDRLGITAAHLPLGYLPRLTRIARAPEQDIDVLFYGSMNERRWRVLEALRARGARVHDAFAVYGAARDALIARARIVLNMHYYDAKVFEAVRVSWLLANRCCVVSERGSDASEEAEYADGVAFADYDALVDTCMRLLGDPAERQRLAAAGLALMRQRPIEPLLQRLLG